MLSSAEQHFRGMWGTFIVALLMIVFTGLLALAFSLFTSSANGRALAYGLGMLVFAWGLVAWLERQDVLSVAVPRGEVSIQWVFKAAASVFAAMVTAALITGTLIAIFGGQDDLISEDMLAFYDETHVLALLFMGAVAAAITEEIVFRGVILGWLMTRGVRPVVAVVIVALFFAALHLQYNAIGMVAILIYGIMFGLLRLASGGIAVPIIAHSGLNAGVLILQQFIELPQEATSILG